MKDLPIQPQDFGGCPICGGGHTINVRRYIFGICEQHMMMWSVGAFECDCWKSENERIWRENEALLDKCEPVEPRYYQLAIDELRSLRSPVLDTVGIDYG